MESVGILRALWRRRLLVGIGALLSCAMALLGAYRISLAPPSLESRATTIGVARERVLIDTPSSLVADATAPGAESIVTRATLLGQVMASDDARRTMAAKIGIRESELDVVGSGTMVPVVRTPLAEAAIEASKPRAPYVVGMGEEPGLSILTIQAGAPDRASAAKLAAAATATLTSVNRRLAVAGGDVRIEPIGTAIVASRTLGGGKAKGFMVGFVFFLVWCAGAIGLDALLRRLRRPPAGAMWEQEALL